MPLPQYGKIVYELPKAVRLAEDIVACGDLREGGEQYPNGFSCDDSAARLTEILDKNATNDYSEECLTHIRQLVVLLRKGGKYCCFEADDISALATTAVDIMRTMPAAWSPSI